MTATTAPQTRQTPLSPAELAAQAKAEVQDALINGAMKLFPGSGDEKHADRDEHGLIAVEIYNRRQPDLTGAAANFVRLRSRRFRQRMLWFNGAAAVLVSASAALAPAAWVLRAAAICWRPHRSERP